jgi:cobalt-zinc-cadmium efflux system protein
MTEARQDPCGCDPALIGCQGLDRTGGNERRVPALRVALVIAVTIMLAEVAGWWLTGGSLVVLSDAGHMLSDVGSIGLALFAAWIAGRPATSARTYGYYRAEILAALVNGAALFGITFWLVWEAWDRLTRPDRAPPLDARLMIGLGTFTFLANLFCAYVLHRAMPHAHEHDHDHDHGHEGEAHHKSEEAHDLNLRGAFLHVLGDVLASLGTVVAGVVILETGWVAADAVAATFLSVLILASAASLVLRSVDVLLESAPRHVDVAAFEAALGRVEGIRGVHDLHVWTITSGLYAMSAHVRVAVGSDPRKVLADMRALIRDRFGIDHTTIQIEVEEREPAAPG